MEVFDLDEALMGDYERFWGSFGLIRAPDIKASVDTLYASGRFWPEPLVSINPRYESDAAVDSLAAEGTLHPLTAKVFRAGGAPLILHRHQAQAVAKRGKEFRRHFGTGSGTSLCFFIPIIDAAIDRLDKQ